MALAVCSGGPPSLRRSRAASRSRCCCSASLSGACSAQRAPAPAPVRIRHSAPARGSPRRARRDRRSRGKCSAPGQTRRCVRSAGRSGTAACRAAVAATGCRSASALTCSTMVVQRLTGFETLLAVVQEQVGVDVFTAAQAPRVGAELDFFVGEDARGRPARIPTSPDTGCRRTSGAGGRTGP